MGEKQQFNVYLPADLVRAVKIASIDARQSLSAFVEAALRNHLEMLRVSEEEARKYARGDGA